MKSIYFSAAVFTAALAMAGGANAATTFATQIDAGRAGVAGAGFEATSPVFNTSRDDAGNALGARDVVSDTDGGFYSLGRGNADDSLNTGVAVFGFGTSFGLEATVFEVTFGCSGATGGSGSCGNFAEFATVYAFNGPYTPFDNTFTVADLLGLGFSEVGTIGNGDANSASGATISIAGPFTFLAIADASNQGADGFDIDAVSVNAVPLPASILFLLGGIGGLGFMRMRRTA
ncbi:VPLPA-CTERM sorting domain-containing protein [Pikeienuella piscinae]|uniref:VPLPA-CTERM sorting domain-containing protein n=1 Tax=Pikeienuella piscinae TaxID=2748098 RepID=A0A7L5BTD9_9RHOB|nr:VPLPA-CTERM sorting domain-containing protein [Pikeienuella piscinae]QIE53983.1 VPLPA-CTERM sorting domain-containing protein [Pikeienuella piscinae]